MKILHKDCDPTVAENKGLPRNSFLVSYNNNDKVVTYDIVQANSTVEIFDKYWDEYRNVLSIDWTQGIVNPKSYGIEPSDKKKKK